MIQKRKFKFITQEDFDLIKELHSLGMTIKQISNLTGRSANTIVRIGQSENLTDYHERKRDSRSKTQPVSPGTRRNLSRSDFDKILAIHNVTGGQLSHRRIAKIVGFSEATVNRVIQAGDWESYQNLKEEVAKARREQYEAESVVSEPVDPGFAVIAEEVEAIEPSMATEPEPEEVSQDLTEGLEEIVNNWRLSSAQLENRLRQLGY